MHTDTLTTERPSEGILADAELIALETELLTEPTSESTGEAPTIDISAEKAAMYAEAPAGTDLDLEKPAVEGPSSSEKTAAGSTKTRKPRVTFATPSAAIMHRTGGDASVFVFETGDEALTEDTRNAKRDDVLAQVDTLAKKVKEKAVNFFGFLKTGERLSNYSRVALNALIEKGSITTKELVDEMQKSYKPGTARSQSQQLMTLFPVLKIATRERGKITLNPNSAIVARIKASAS